MRTAARRRDADILVIALHIPRRVIFRRMVRIGIQPLGILQAFARRRAVGKLHRIEIERDGRARLLAGGIDDPKNEKERHHGGHEVGKGDLPDATVMMIVIVVPAAPDDDDFVRSFLFRHGEAHEPEC